MYEVIEQGAKLDQTVKVGHFTVIKKGAKIGKNTVIGDYCYIDSGVVIGENNYIGTGVYLKGKVTVGCGNYILDKTVIGLPGKHIGYHFYQGRIIIGNNNFIGNGCAIDCGNNHLSDKHPELLGYASVDLAQGSDFEDATIIGNRCYILNNVTIHHNCRVGLGSLADSKDEFDTVICSGCCLNGFVQVHKGCELSSGTYIREFAAVGEGALTAMMSHIVKDVPPFAFIRGNKNVGRCERLVNKFEMTDDKIRLIQSQFATKRSSRVDIYETLTASV